MALSSTPTLASPVSSRQEQLDTLQQTDDLRRLGIQANEVEARLQQLLNMSGVPVLDKKTSTKGADVAAAGAKHLAATLATEGAAELAGMLVGSSGRMITGTVRHLLAPVLHLAASVVGKQSSKDIGLTRDVSFDELNKRAIAELAELLLEGNRIAAKLGQEKKGDYLLTYSK